MPMEPARAAARSERMSACYNLSVGGLLSRFFCDAYQVCRHDRIQAFGLQHHAGCHRINQHLVNSHIRELGLQLLGNLVPEDHAVALRVALGDDGQHLARTLLGSLKREPHDSLHAVAREDRDFGGDLPGLSLVRSATLPGVLAFAVLADNHPVEVAGLALAQRRLSPAEHSGRTHVGVLLQRLADGQTETPEGDVIRDICTYVSVAPMFWTSHFLPGAPTAPKKIASCFFNSSSPPSGIYLPVFLNVSELQS